MKGGLFWLAGCIAVANGFAQEVWEPFHPLPPKFPVIRDELGYAWPLTSSGSFYSPGGNVFDSANQLAIGGARFQAERVERRGERFAFVGRCGPQWAVRREVWIDRERSAAFCLEEIRNETGEIRDLDLELSTHFRTPWRSWSAREGNVLIPGAPQASGGAFLSFPVREGDSDLFFLWGDGVTIQAENQIFTARFGGKVAAGGRMRILHVMGQRRADPGDVQDQRVFAPFVEGNRILASGVTGPLANFQEVDSGAPGAVWKLRDGTEWELAEPCDGEIEVLSALGRVRFHMARVVRFDGRVWETLDGVRAQAVVLPGQRLSAVTVAGRKELPAEALARIRAPGTVSSPATSLRLKNGDVWPGREAGKDGVYLRWELDGQIREVPLDWVLREEEKP